MVRGKSFSGGVFALLILSGVGALSIGPAEAASPAAPVFRFSGAGDFGVWTGFEESLRQLQASGSDFVLALGDLSYNGTSEQIWCTEFRQGFQNVIIVAGNHETGLAAEAGGSINEFTVHCPFPLDVLLDGVYGKQFYFDYPLDDPLARFILISPGLVFHVDGGESYDYSVGTQRYIWTRNAIDEAREAGIPWVVVGSHKNCIAAGDHGCEIGTDIMDLLLDRKVDLILQAHNHHYERSKQLALSDGCRGIVVGEYNPACVVDPGSDDEYTKGAGSVLVIAGTGGRDIIDFDEGNPFAGYIARYGHHPADVGKGIVTFGVSHDRLTMETQFNASFRDEFTMTASPVSPSLFETLPRGVPLVAPVVVSAEMVVIAWIISRRPKRRSLGVGPAPRPSARCRPASSAGMANGGTAVKLEGKRFVLDGSGALRLED